MALSIEQFINEVAASGLVPAADLFTWLSAIPESERPKDGEELARELVKHQRLTKFQSEQIYAGQGKSLTLGNYLILDKLGQGGMGVVLKAMHRRMERIVALKVMSQAGMKSPDAVQRFHREVKAAAKLVHPNIVVAHDADEANGTHFLVMEYIEGTDLSAFIKKHGPMTIEQAVSCIIQAARGLQFAHENGVIHRDIKPSNLLLAGCDRIHAVGPDESGHYEHDVIKILDMGLARIEGAESAQGELTTTGAVLGTVDYMAPEQALSAKSADARSDIYSLGITLWYLLTGRVVYEGDSMMAKLLAHRDAAIPSLSDFSRTGVRQPADEVSTVPSPEAVAPRLAREKAYVALDTVFRRMVAKRSEDRYQSMTEVILDLERCLAGTDPMTALPSIMSNHSSETLPNETTVGSQETALNQSADETETVVLFPRDAGADLRAGQSLTLAGSRLQSPATGRTSKWRLAPFGLLVTGVLLLLAIVFSRSNQPDQRGGQQESTHNEDRKITDAMVMKTDVVEPSDSLPPNYALQFSKFNHRVELPALKLNADESHTIEAYVTPANDQVPAKTIGHFVELKDRLSLKMHDENLSTFHARLIQPSGEIQLFSVRATKLLKGRCTHVAGVQTAGDIRLFIDGKRLAVTRTEGNRFAETMTSGFIGGGAGSMGFFDGVIDEVRISNTARYDKDFTPESRFKADDKTLALYHCDEGVGIELLDSSGNNRHGKLFGATWVKGDESSSAPAPLRSPVTTRKPPLAKAPFTSMQARTHQETWAAHLNVPRETTNSASGKMVLIPPGEFLMGSSDEQLGAIIKEVEQLNLGRETIDRILKQERPQHRVILTRPFFLGATEVTIGQFKKFVEATGFKTYAEANATDAQGRTYLKPGYLVTDDCPVSCVCWEEAAAYCRWLSGIEKSNYRLPTEAEWEYACRAGTRTLWSWGDDPTLAEKFAWTQSNSESRAHPVASKKPNPFGVFDMHGNLSEWCQDTFDETWYARSPVADPIAHSNTHINVRGGAFGHFAITRSAYRTGITQDNTHPLIGFRVLREVDSPHEQSSPDRSAAEWVIAQGGSVMVFGQEKWIVGTDDLPLSGLRLVHVKLGRSLSGADADLVPLRQLNNVVSVNMDSSNVSAAGIAGLESLPALEQVGLGGVRLSDEQLTALARLKGLKQLGLHGVDLTPEQCATLARALTQLVYLNLSSNQQVNDTALDALRQLANLTLLELNGTQVTAAGVAALQKALPNCKIQWGGESK